jgi:hypothetical protein
MMAKSSRSCGLVRHFLNRVGERSETEGLLPGAEPLKGRLISKSMKDGASPVSILWSWIGLQALSEIVLQELGGQGRLREGHCELRFDGPGQLRIGGWAFDAMTGKRGGNESD